MRASILCAAALSSLLTVGEGLAAEHSPHHHEEPADRPTPTQKSIYWLEGSWETDTGGSIPLRRLEGKPVLLVMLYTSCTSACPILIQDAKQVVRLLTPEERADIQVTIVSVDPERDTPHRLSEFKKKHGEGIKDWLFLRGSASSTRELEALLGIRVRSIGGGEFAHTNKITVLNDEGEIVHQATGLRTPAEETAAALRRLLHGGTDPQRR